MLAFMLPRDVALFLHSARTDAKIRRLKTSLGSVSAALEAVYADDPDPWSSASPKYRYQSRKYDELLAFLPKARYRNALDLGCGVGLFTRRLTEVAEEVTGVDVSSSAVDEARRLSADHSRVTFEATDLLALPSNFSGLFDLVVVADVLYYLSPLNGETLSVVVERIASLLKPEGICLLANHYFTRFDADSRRSKAIHDAFRSSRSFRVRTESWRPFYLLTILGSTGK